MSPVAQSERRARYLAQTGHLTPKQARRLKHKLNHALATTLPAAGRKTRAARRAARPSTGGWGVPPDGTGFGDMIAQLNLGRLKGLHRRKWRR